MIDWTWWFFLFWLPGGICSDVQLDLKTFGLPLAAIYIISDIGSVDDSWLWSWLIKRGVSVSRAPKFTMLIRALRVLPVWVAQSLDSVWIVASVISLATAAHQAFSANLYTLPSDLFPRAAVGTVIGIGGTVGGMGMDLFTGYIPDTTKSYDVLFAICASAYLVALLIVHILSPGLKPVSRGVMAMPGGRALWPSEGSVGWAKNQI